MSYLLTRFSEVDHLASSVDKVAAYNFVRAATYVSSVRLWKLLGLPGMGMPALYPSYVKQRTSVRHYLINGVEETDGDDPLDRMLRGIEKTGLSIFSGEGKPGMIPKFAATMLLALRAALGRLESSDLNRKLVEAEYRRICRARDVRLTVVESNRAITIDAYFNETLFDEVVDSKKRLPRWLRWIIGFYEPDRSSVAPCW